MKPEEQKFIVHEGLTELEDMKRTMLNTVVRYGLWVLCIAFAGGFLWSIVRAVMWLSAIMRGGR